MGQHSKYSFEMKSAAVTKYPEGSCLTESIARSPGTNRAGIIEWATIYQSLGAEGLKTSQKPGACPAETKRSAVCDYLSGKGTLREIRKKYGIRSDKQLRNRIMKHNGHENPKSSGTGGTSTMTRGRKTTYDERVEMAGYCIGHETDQNTRRTELLHIRTLRICGDSTPACYKWPDRRAGANEKSNRELCSLIKDAYEEKNGIPGYRQMTIKLNRENDFHVNEKRILRLMGILQLKSVCRRRRNYVKPTPEITAENIPDREFHADHFGEKWLTDVTGMKYGINGKAYLGAILDLEYYNNHRYQKRLNCMTPIEYRKHFACAA